MRLIHVVGCCLTLSMFVTMSTSALFGGTGDVEVGLVKPKKSQPARVEGSNGSKDNSNTSEQAYKKKKEKVTSDVSEKEQKPKPILKKPQVQEVTEVQEKMKEETLNTASPPMKVEDPVPDVKKDTPPPTPVTNNEVVETPVVPSPKPEKKRESEKTPKVTTDNSEVKEMLKTNQDKAEAVINAEKDMKKEQKSLFSMLAKKETSSSSGDLSDATRNVVKLAKKRTMLKAAFTLYTIINAILYAVNYAGKALPVPFNTIVNVLDIIATKLARQPLSDYYAKYRDENAEILAQYVDKHRADYKNVRVGRKVVVKTAKHGKHTFIMLKDKPGDELAPQALSLADQNPYQLVKLLIQMKR